MTAAHRLQNLIAAGLNGQMHPVAKIFIFIDRIDNVWMKIPRKRSRKFDSLDSGAGDGAQKTRKRGCSAENLQARFRF